mmetsp:Transcript_8779/g.13109  ORF Transcript_8779/g.13109 Transcript_8779/m.13109 type:complete len:323 (-) Transcript_8779:149-1117(-)|eukprot:CAMPEP_0167758384 /NCGR_PEP_ID=MMETSP0110_2-20121227/10439_1 /TAXON_ID=629695 /ORGANISM="Gymnochlora sp., Strain CCMP2014" /LENGTH=322 /DNA_ID=CAMNT_0007644655 /DNA_START=47 /DNA_END=1015 /DNA_ORIENTATION=-
MPIAVGDYVKKFKDLLGKKYKNNSSNDLVVKASSDGLSLEPKIMSTYPNKAAEKGPQGAIKLKYKNKPYASELELYTDSQDKCTGKFTNKSIKGVKITVAGDAIPSKLSEKDKTNVKLELGYNKDYFNGKITLKYINQIGAFKTKKGNVSGDLSFHVMDGVAVGGTFESSKDLSKDDTEFKLGKWGLGGNITQGDVIFGLYSTKLKDVHAGLHYKLDKKTSFGCQVVTKTGTKTGKDEKTKEVDVTRTYDLGASHQFNPSTVVQAKVSVSNGYTGEKSKDLAYGYGGVIEYTYPDLSSKIQLTSTVDAKGSKMGVLVTAGDC